MQYMLLIYSGDSMAQWESLGDDEQKAIMDEYMAISESPQVSGGAQL